MGLWSDVKLVDVKKFNKCGKVFYLECILMKKNHHVKMHHSRWNIVVCGFALTLILQHGGHFASIAMHRNWRFIFRHFCTWGEKTLKLKVIHFCWIFSFILFSCYISEVFRPWIIFFSCLFPFRSYITAAHQTPVIFWQLVFRRRWKYSVTTVAQYNQKSMHKCSKEEK